MATEPLRLSTGARLSAIFAALLVGAFLMAGTITFFATARTVENAIRERIALEMQAMEFEIGAEGFAGLVEACLLSTSPSPRDRTRSRMPSSA